LQKERKGKKRQNQQDESKAKENVTSISHMSLLLLSYSVLFKLNAIYKETKLFFENFAILETQVLLIKQRKL